MATSSQTSGTPRRILVTGGNGFLGSNLVRMLARRGDRVRSLDIAPTPCVAAEGDVERIAGDLRDPQAVDAAVRGCDLVLHAGAAFREERLPESEFFATNVGGTRHVIEACRRHAVQRLVYVSTAGVHGHVAHPPANEESPLAPRDFYQQSKLDGERLAASTSAEGLPVSVVRPTGIYGPSDTRLLKLFRGIARRRFPMIGSGSALYHLTFIDDICEGVLLAGEHPAALGGVFLLAGPRAVPIRELIERIATALQVPPPRFHLPLRPFQIAAPVVQRACRAIGVEPPLYPRRLEFFTDDRWFDARQAREVLGWNPRVDLDEGITRTVAWYREQGML